MADAVVMLRGIFSVQNCTSFNCTVKCAVVAVAVFSPMPLCSSRCARDGGVELQTQAAVGCNAAGEQDDVIDAAGNRQEGDVACARARPCACTSLSWRCRKVHPHSRTHAPLVVAIATPWQRAGVPAGSAAADLAYAKEEEGKK